MYRWTLSTPKSCRHNNLFQIYMPRVDYWLLADNSISPRVIVAEGYQHGEDRIYELELFKCIKNYVK
jgi:hypothetical protein